MKIALMTDLEGTAGVTSFSQETYPEGRDHILARRLAMAEVNAAVDGFLEAGAEDVLIIDGHGPGGLWFEDMHPEASMLHGRPTAPRSVRDSVLQDYDGPATVESYTVMYGPEGPKAGHLVCLTPAGERVWANVEDPAERVAMTESETCGRAVMVDGSGAARFV